MNKLEAIKKTLELATPEPWHFDNETGNIFRAGTDHGLGMMVSFEDAQLVANAPADIKWLLEVVRRMKPLVEEHLDTLECICDAMHYCEDDRTTCKVDGYCGVRALLAKINGEEETPPKEDR